MNGTQRILGIDPGSRITGFGIIDTKSSCSTYVTSGCVRMETSQMMTRMREIFEALGQLIEQYQPHEIAIERVFVHRNADSALKLGQARAAALCASFSLELPVFEYTPREIKLAVVGTGAADKVQVQHMVKMLLQLAGDVQADAADALAVALCRAGQRTTTGMLGTVAGVGGQ